MKAHMQLGDFLVAYLRKAGVSRLFGIPGDLVIQLFMKFGKPRDMRVMTFSHEPGAGFAVDGYARATGAARRAVCHLWGGRAECGQCGGRLLL